MSFQWEQPLHSPYTGATLNMQPTGAMYIMQDGLTGLHAAKKCGNMEMKAEFNCFWVVTKSKVRFVRYPAWHETVHVTACTADAGRIRTELVTRMTDAHGLPCVEARQELCVLDFERHRPQRLRDVNFEAEVPALPPAGYERFDFGELPEHHTQMVFPHMVDMSGHMNNVEYVKVAMDCFDGAFTARREVQELETHHLRECKEGAVLSVGCKTEGDVSCLRLTADGEAVFEMKVIWRDKV